MRVAVLGRLITELGPHFGRCVVVEGAEGNPTLRDLAEVALHFVRLRHIELAKDGLDFWYDVTSEHFGAAAEEDDPFDEEVGVVIGRATGSSAAVREEQEAAAAQRRERERPRLVP